MHNELSQLMFYVLLFFPFSVLYACLQRLVCAVYTWLCSSAATVN
jgi:hypothetical protein